MTKTTKNLTYVPEERYTAKLYRLQNEFDKEQKQAIRYFGGQSTLILNQTSQYKSQKALYHLSHFLPKALGWGSLSVRKVFKKGLSIDIVLTSKGKQYLKHCQDTMKIEKKILGKSLHPTKIVELLVQVSNLEKATTLRQRYSSKRYIETLLYDLQKYPAMIMLGSFVRITTHASQGLQDTVGRLKEIKASKYQEQRMERLIDNILATPVLKMTWHKDNDYYIKNKEWSQSTSITFKAIEDYGSNHDIEYNLFVKMPISKISVFIKQPECITKRNHSEYQRCRLSAYTDIFGRWREPRLLDSIVPSSKEIQVDRKKVLRAVLKIHEEHIVRMTHQCLKLGKRLDTLRRRIQSGDYDTILYTTKVKHIRYEYKTILKLKKRIAKLEN